MVRRVVPLHFSRSLRYLVIRLREEWISSHEEQSIGAGPSGVSLFEELSPVSFKSPWKKLLGYLPAYLWRQERVRAPACLGFKKTQGKFSGQKQSMCCLDQNMQKNQSIIFNSAIKVEILQCDIFSVTFSTSFFPTFHSFSWSKTFISNTGAQETQTHSFFSFGIIFCSYSTAIVLRSLTHTNTAVVAY